MDSRLFGPGAMFSAKQAGMKTASVDSSIGSIPGSGESKVHSAPAVDEDKAQLRG